MITADPTTEPSAQARAIIRVLRHRLDPQSFPDELIEIAVLAAWDRFTAARIRAYVPLLIEHQVLDILLGRAAAGSTGSPDRAA